jgi:hypothetical protein
VKARSIAEIASQLEFSLPSDHLANYDLFGGSTENDNLDFGWLLGLPTFGYADDAGSVMGIVDG